MAPIPNPPRYLVILAGWLGCQPRSLRKYERLYQRLLGGAEKDGVAVVSHIATPAAVIELCLGRPQAMDILAQHVCNHIVKERDADGRKVCTIFHCFSNGGFFLWDRVQRLLSTACENDSTPPTVPNQQQTVQATAVTADERWKFSGIIFDSCPIVDTSLLPRALQHCTWQERAQVIQSCRLDYLNPDKLTLLDADTIYHRITTDSAPQLFFYCRDDPLTPADLVDTLVAKGRADSCVWNHSQHCGHLLVHPNEYEQALAKFISGRIVATTGSLRL